MSTRAHKRHLTDLPYLLANSPCSAILKSSISRNASKTPLTTAFPPWICNSTESSPVKLRGPGNHKIKPRSRTWPVFGCLMRLKWAILGSTGLVVIFSITFFHRKACQCCLSYIYICLELFTFLALFPDTRMTATPAFPGEVDSAYIVSGLQSVVTLQTWCSLLNRNEENLCMSKITRKKKKEMQYPVTLFLFFFYKT